MATMKLKNKRMKMSPGGIITLPVSARKTLKMKKGLGARVTVAVAGKALEIKPVKAKGGFRVSKNGMLELRENPRELLAGSDGRHYWLELNDDKGTVLVHPY